MKRMACGTAATLALVGLAACFSNPANDLNNDNFNKVQATPVVMFTKVGDSIQLRLRLVNDANNAAITSFTIAGVGAGVSVRYDDLFRPFYLNGDDTLVVPVDKNIQQYYVKGVAPGTWTFTATATANTSATGTITVTVESKDLGAALSPTTGLSAGDEVTITATPGLVFSQTSAVSFETGTAVVVGRAADSTSITVIVGPGTSGAATVTKVGTAANPVIGVQTLSTTNALTAVPSVTVAPTTVSTASPAFGASMTVTLGGSLKFIAGSKILVGGNQGFITSVSADSSTATFVPLGGSTGNVTYTGIVLGFLTSVGLDVPGNKTVTVGAAASDPNALAIGTASTFAMPAAVGATAVLSDGASSYAAGGPCAAIVGGNGCRYYKIVVTSTGTYSLELRWDTAVTADLGGFLTNAAGTALGNGGYADSFGDQAGGPETGTWSNLAAGTYYIMIAQWGGGAPSFHFGIKRTS